MSLEWVESDMIFLSGFAPPRACAVEVGLGVVRWWSADIPLVVWWCAFGKLGGVISYLVGPVRLHRGHSYPDPTPFSVSSIYAAILPLG